MTAGSYTGVQAFHSIKYVKLFSYLMLFCWSQGLFAQPFFEHITSDDGLSENVVNCILQDSRGFMWFGTNDGLSKYDGNKFRSFKPNFTTAGGLSSNLIFALAEDKHGNIWIGTTGSGICKFDPSTEIFTSYKHDPKNDASISDNHIISLFVDARGRVWVGTTKGLNVFDPSSERTDFHRIALSEHNFSDEVFRIKQDQKGNIWVGSKRGLFMSYENEKIDQISFTFQKLSISDAVDLVSDFSIDHTGRLVIIRGVSVFYQVKVHELSFVRLDISTKANTILIDKKNRIWVGADDGLYSFWNHANDHIPELENHYQHQDDDDRSLSKNLVNSLYQERNGIIWVGVNGGGLNKFDPDRKAFTYVTKLSNDLESEEKIRAVLEDSFGNLWLGTEGNGLFWKDGSFGGAYRKSFKRIGSVSRPFALEEVVFGDRRWLYIGAEDSPSLLKVDITEGRPKNLEVTGDFKNSVFSLFQDKDANLWIGTYNGGLWRWTSNDGGKTFTKVKFTHDPENPSTLSNNIIRVIRQDNRGHIWIGTGEGLNKISYDQVNQDTIQFERFKQIVGDSNSLSHNYILDIIESRTGDIWIGTFGGGLNQLKLNSDAKSYAFQSYTEANGLANNIIKSILEDEEGKIWLSSNKGLTRFSPQDNTVFNFSLIDGLQGNEFSEGAAFTKKNGEMIFGGVNGFNIFLPDQIVIKSSQPEIHFTNLYIFNDIITPKKEYNGRIVLDHALSFTDGIELKHSENNFSIEFTAIDYTAPRQIQYKYKLEEYEKNWKVASSLNRLATYTNLSSGTYTLKVMASNADGIWGDHVEELSIKINPPTWLTWYAMLFYIGFLIFGLWVFRRYELIGIQEKNDLRVAQLEREKKEEIHDLKLKFFTNISHELRTPLTLIIAPLENLIKEGTNLSIEKVREQYHLMYKNSKYLLRLVNQLLDFRKLDQGKLNLEVHQGDILEFIKEASEPFQFIAHKQQITFSVQSQESAIYIWFDPDIIEKILYNLLSNAFKNTPSKGQVVVVLSTVDTTKRRGESLENYVQLEIKNTGRGIPTKIQKRIFERFYKEEGKRFSNDGAGIGLSFTKSLVHRHYGEIMLQSKIEEGANFIVKLPISKNVYAKGEFSNTITHDFNRDPLEYFTPDKPSVLPKLNVEETAISTDVLPLLLFIDDNQDIRKFIKRGFENDFRIIDAENGKSGLEIAKSSLPDIIISDIMMPVMDGIELCNNLKSDVNTSHIPIVLLTAKSTNESEMEGLEIGADAYIRKPFRLDILRQQILNIHHHRELLKSKFKHESILHPKEITVTSVDERFLQMAVDLIHEHMSDTEYNVEAMVKDMLMSRSKLYLKIKALTGYSTSEFIRTIRLKRAVQLLEKSDYTIKEIMFMTGFNTASYFSKCFKKLYGVVPSEYVREQKKDHPSQSRELDAKI